MDTVTIFITLFYIFATLGVVAKVILNLLNIRHIAKNADHVPQEFSYKINLADHQKAAAYTTEKLKFANGVIIFNFVLLLIWIPFGGIQMLDEFSRSLNYGELTTGLIFFGLFALIGLIIELPESLYKTFVIEEKFGFNKTTPKLFVVDFFKHLILNLIIGAPLLFTLMYFMEKLGHLWWLYAWGFIVAFQFLIIWAYPKFIAPLFNKFSKLSNEELKVDIDHLIDRCELNFKAYYVMDASIRSSHGNAYFTGFGKNKRIVFFDTLLKTLENNEVISVLAHELGHLKHKHILKSLLWGILFMGIGFFLLGALYQSPKYLQGLSGAQHSSYIGLLLFSYITSVFTFAFTPIGSLISRKKEYEADEFATRYASGEALITALIKMYKDNSSTLTPSPVYSKFYYSHPPALERVEFIKQTIEKLKSK
jgi:STE24 endopeptidase